MVLLLSLYLKYITRYHGKPFVTYADLRWPSHPPASQVHSGDSATDALRWQRHRCIQVTASHPDIHDERKLVFLFSHFFNSVKSTLRSWNSRMRLPSVSACPLRTTPQRASPLRMLKTSRKISVLVCCSFREAPPIWAVMGCSRDNGMLWAALPLASRWFPQILTKISLFQNPFP